MGRASILDITELSRDEKLELLARLWESLGQDPGPSAVKHIDRPTAAADTMISYRFLE